VVAAHALVERRGSELTRQEIAEELSGHVCRCTGYVNILSAVERAARA
jgi:aerobic carbon-monoxide dehydrogenase small subunit